MDKDKINRKVTHTEGTTKTRKIASEGSHLEFSKQRLQRNYHKYIHSRNYDIEIIKTKTKDDQQKSSKEDLNLQKT